MNQEIIEEAIGLLEKEILFGFENEEDLLEGISELFYDEDDFDEEWLKQEIKVRLKKHEKDSLNWEKPTDFDRLVKAFDKLNSEFIVSLHKAGFTRQDGEGDCLEIIHELKNKGIKAKGYCYYHSQDLERAIGDEKHLFIGYDSFNGNDVLALEVANKIVEVLQKHGFKIEWNGSLEQRIQISYIDWKKTVDDIDYNYSRVFEIIEKSHEEKNDKLNPNQNKKPFWKFW